MEACFSTAAIAIATFPTPGFKQAGSLAWVARAAALGELLGLELEVIAQFARDLIVRRAAPPLGEDAHPLRLGGRPHTSAEEQRLQHEHVEHALNELEFVAWHVARRSRVWAIR